MPEITLESLAARIEALEKKLAQQAAPSPIKDWRSTIGMFADSELAREVDAEIAAAREAERESARRERSNDPA
jgi:hypothetical protein